MEMSFTSSGPHHKAEVGWKPELPLKAGGGSPLPVPASGWAHLGHGDLPPVSPPLPMALSHCVVCPPFRRTPVMLS